MMMVVRRGGILLFTFAAAAVLVPVRFSTGEPLSAAAAECTTCCTKEGLLCVVCAKTCVTVPNAYDRGDGACPTADNPNMT